MSRQLNIRSDEAYETARRISRRLNVSTTEVVKTALALYDRQTSRVPTYEELSPEQKAFADQMLSLARAGREEGDPNATSDHSFLYDEIGAPK
jgi:hypothetical protein